MSKLINTKHDYYCYSNDKLTYDSFDEFLVEWIDADKDYNFLIRYDFVEVEEDVGDNGKVWNADTELHLFYILQRKSILREVSISNIKEDDESKIIEFLKPHWKQMKKVWKGISNLK